MADCFVIGAGVAAALMSNNTVLLFAMGWAFGRAAHFAGLPIVFGLLAIVMFSLLAAVFVQTVKR